MSAENHITIVGNLVKDPEVTVLNNEKQTKVANFSVAVSRFVGAGQDKQTDYFDCKAFGQRAENIARFFSKGRRIIVSGSMQSRQWEDKNGSKRTSWEIFVEDYAFADSKQSGSETPAPAKKTAAPKPAPATEDDDDDEPW